MFVLRIEHPVLNYDAWKKAFDSDPVGREDAGVKRYRIMRPTDDHNFIMVELEFDSAQEAQGLLTALRDVWRRVEGKLIETARSRIVEVLETVEY